MERVGRLHRARLMDRDLAYLEPVTAWLEQGEPRAECPMTPTRRRGDDATERGDRHTFDGVYVPQSADVSAA